MVFYKCKICGWTQIKKREVENHIKQTHFIDSLILTSNTLSGLDEE